jgi:TP901 family phage tail tape measure protein
MQSSLNSITGNGIGNIQAGVVALGGALDGINSAGLGEAQAGISRIGVSANGIIPPLQETVGYFDDLADMLGMTNTAYLDSTNDSLIGIGASLSQITPKAKDLQSIFDTFKSETLSQAHKGIAEINAGIEVISRNSGLTIAAGHLSNMAQATAPVIAKMNNLIDEPSKLSMSFESSLKNIQVVTGYTSNEMGILKGQLLSIGGQAVAGPLAVADAYNDVARGITNTKAQLGVLTSSIALAEAGQADLGVAANGMVKVMNAYGFAAGTAEEATKKAAFTADVFTQTVGMGVGSMDEFVSSMSPVAGLAASVGVGFDEMGSAMAYATSKGQTTSVAATQIKAAITSMLNPNDTLAKALSSMGIESGSAMLQQYGLAESLNIVKSAMGGSQDAMAKALGSTEALQIAVALTQEGYNEFASTFADGMVGITSAAQSVQLESLEAKMARLEGVSGSLKTQIGMDINAIKGVFVEMKTGFLSDVVAPIMSSPIGGAISKVTAVLSVGTSQILSMGSAALSTAAQMTTLAANIKNAGGYAQILHGAMTVLGAPFKAARSGIAGIGKVVIGVLPAMGGWIASMWSAAAATIAATWPILAIIAGVAALAAGAYLIVKHWDAVSGFFVGLWNNVTGVFSSAWEVIKTVFSSALNGIKNIFMGLPNWVVGLLAIFFPFISLPMLMVNKWDVIKGFFIALFSEIKASISAFINELLNNNLRINREVSYTGCTNEKGVRPNGTGTTESIVGRHEA